MGRTIGEVAALCGVSVRALHYYDEIGLLKPSEVTEAGYRLYDGEAVARLEQILFFRALSFPLSDIRDILNRPDYDRAQALSRQRTLLLQERERLDALIRTLEHSMKGEMDMKKEQTGKTPEEIKNQYADEAREKYGKTDAYRESEQKTASYGKAEWAAAQASIDTVMDAFAARRNDPPETAGDLVEAWKAHITQYYYKCTDEILAGLGQMYVADARFTENIDRHGEGTAAFMSAAIAAYTQAKKA